MTDKELLDYAYYHSRTERALFHYSHIKRLFELAHIEMTGNGLDSGGWASMGPAMVDKIIERVRLRELNPMLERA